MRSLLIALALLAVPLHAKQILPVFLSDNHAETFAWITRNFDPDDRFHLVLIDAHSDASMAERSEEIRERIRRVPSPQARSEQIQSWRSTGHLQAFNWIEPLMPRPISQVLWVSAHALEEKERILMTDEARSLLDGRLEVEPRASGSFAHRWQTLDLKDYLEWDPGNHPVLLSIDLDFFTGMGADERETIFDAIWQRAMDWPGLAGVSLSVSRPWLADDAEADALVSLASSTISRTRGAVLEIDAEMDRHPDTSRQAAQSDHPLPRWDAAKASPGLRSIWRTMHGHLEITENFSEKPHFTDSVILPFIKPDHGEMDCDGVWRFPMEQAPVLRIRPINHATGRVRWHALEPARAAYDFLPHTGLGKDFSESPGRWIYEKRRSLGITEDFSIAANQWSSGAPGRVRLEAEMETHHGWITIPPIEIRLAQGEGFHGALSECFRMPYGFGIAGIVENELSAVETGWASDCANLLIHAWRRNGLPLAWGDPGRLRNQLVPLAEAVTLSHKTEIPPEMVKRGIAIDFGKHVAALWEDVEPFGILDENDWVIHQLGNFPEVVPLHALAKDRPVFSLYAPRHEAAPFTVKIAGDVVLASEKMTAIPGFEKGEASVFLANLEGVPSFHAPARPPRFDFRFPPERLKGLRELGVDAVSMANNHAGDAGPEGLIEGLLAVQKSGIGVFGAGKDASSACQPWRTKANGVRIAVFGVCLVDSLIAGPDQPGVAHLPTHATLLESQLHQAKNAGKTIIVLLHGGDEYRGKVNEDQRKWARWLIHRGAALIAGAHPHIIQRTEFHGGATIVHSLGNAIYPDALKGADSGEIRTFRLGPDPENP